MRKKSTVVLAVLLALAILMGVFWYGKRMGERSSVPEATEKQVPGIGKNIALPPLPAVAPPLFNQAVPPWATSPATGPGTVSGMHDSTTQIKRQKQMAELKEMQMALMKSIQGNHQPDPRQVIGLLDKIKQINGSSVVGGVNLDNLRDNLIRAQEIQRIAAEMSHEAQKPAGADPKKMKAYTEQLQSLQQQLMAATPAFQYKSPAVPLK